MLFGRICTEFVLERSHYANQAYDNIEWKTSANMSRYSQMRTRKDTVRKLSLQPEAV